MDVIGLLTLVVIAFVLAGLIALLRRRHENPAETLPPLLTEAVAEQLTRSERAFREDLSSSARGVRDEVGAQIARLQEQFTGTTRHLFEMQSGDAARVQETVVSQLRLVSEDLQRALSTTTQQAAAIASTVETRLLALQNGNEQRLDQMRHVVEEKLHATLEARLGASFKQVSDRLELVSKGIGEMQQLAVGVGDLRKVLSNVKVRGSWGEIQLEALLSQMLTSSQYEKNVAVVPGSNERVEFAIRIPGATNDGRPVLLPIDCKFPIAAWQRLVEASERLDEAGVEQASKEFDIELRRNAADIASKYIQPPHTADVGILYLPVEALYADVARKAGLLEELMQKYRVVVAGPTSLGAILTTFQMGFQSVAIQERSEEIRKILGGVKADMGKFEGLLQKLHKQLAQAGSTVEELQKRRNILGKKLKHVEDGEATDEDDGLLPAEAVGLLPEADAE